MPRERFNGGIYEWLRRQPEPGSPEVAGSIAGYTDEVIQQLYGARPGGLSAAQREAFESQANRYVLREMRRRQSMPEQANITDQWRQIDPCEMVPQAPATPTIGGATFVRGAYADFDGPCIPDNDERCWLVVNDIDKGEARKIFKGCPEVKVIRSKSTGREWKRSQVFKKKKAAVAGAAVQFTGETPYAPPPARFHQPSAEVNEAPAQINGRSLVESVRCIVEGHDAAYSANQGTTPPHPTDYRRFGSQIPRVVLEAIGSLPNVLPDAYGVFNNRIKVLNAAYVVGFPDVEVSVEEISNLTRSIGVHEVTHHLYRLNSAQSRCSANLITSLSVPRDFVNYYLGDLVEPPNS